MKFHEMVQLNTHVHHNRDTQIQNKNQYNHTPFARAIMNDLEEIVPLLSGSSKSKPILVTSCHVSSSTSPANSSMRPYVRMISFEVQNPELLVVESKERCCIVFTDRMFFLRVKLKYRIALETGLMYLANVALPS